MDGEPVFISLPRLGLRRRKYFVSPMTRSYICLICLGNNKKVVSEFKSFSVTEKRRADILNIYLAHPKFNWP